jgi:hypothetical protein
MASPLFTSIDCLSRPLQLVERGEIDRIWWMLFDLESGQPG